MKLLTPALLTLVLAMLCTFSASSQLSVSNTAPNNNQNHLVQNVLLGSGVVATNITFNGAPVPSGGIASPAIGFFDNTMATTLGIGLDSGIIMTSGTVANAVGPNTNGGISANNTLPGDPDLAVLAGVNTNDANILEFDFVPSADTVRFRYVFASEEYPEYVSVGGGGVNDVFGFFISGPGITGPFSSPAGFPGGSQNIALIPGTTTPVSINTVNDQVNTNYYVANGANPNGSGTILANPDVQYDGFTTVLTAIAVVIPCDTYHIKLAIADGGDFILDSGVFLEAKSFSSGAVTVTAQPTYSQFANDTNLYEGCGNVSLTFQRYANLSNPYTVHYTIAGTATNGVDYSTIADSVVWGAGVDQVTVTFNVIDDGTTEGPETITFIIPPDTANTPCLPPVPTIVTLTINERPALTLNAMNDTVLCSEDSVTLGVQGLTGIPDFQYLWSTGDTLDSLTIANPLTTTTYQVTMTDACGLDTLTDNVTVTVITPPLQVAVTDDTIGCLGDQAIISVAALSGSGPYQYQWGSGGTTAQTNVTLSSTGYVPVTVTDVCGQTVQDSALVSVILPPFSISTNDVTIDCTVDSVQIDVNVGSGTPPYQYTWSHGPTTGSNFVSPSSTTTYYVTVTDACSGQTLIDSVTVTVTQQTPLVMLLNNATSNCPGDPATLTATVNGGNPPYNFNWNTGGTSNSVTVNPNSTTVYTITVTDVCGLTQLVQTSTVTVPVHPPLSVSASDLEVECPGDPAELVASYTGGSGFGYTFQWNFNGQSSTDSIYNLGPLTDPGGFNVVVTDGCGSTAIAGGNVGFQSFPPILIEAGEDVLECSGRRIGVQASVTGGNPPYVFNWGGNGDVSQGVDGGAILLPESTGLFSVQVTDQCGRSATDDMFVELEICQVIIPNVITPNGDQSNEFFVIENLEKFPSHQLVIFNRWGRKVYETTYYRNNWNGDGVPDGVYFYILDIPELDTYKGNVTVLH